MGRARPGHKAPSPDETPQEIATHRRFAAALRRSLFRHGPEHRRGPPTSQRRRGVPLIAYRRTALNKNAIHFHNVHSRRRRQWKDGLPQHRAEIPRSAARRLAHAGLRRTLHRRNDSLHSRETIITVVDVFLNDCAVVGNNRELRRDRRGSWFEGRRQIYYFMKQPATRVHKCGSIAPGPCDMQVISHSPDPTVFRVVVMRIVERPSWGPAERHRAAFPAPPLEGKPTFRDWHNASVHPSRAIVGWQR